MTTTLRRECVPTRASVERIVVGPSLCTATSGPTVPSPSATVLYVFPDGGAAMLGTARSPPGIREVVRAGMDRRRPAAIWLRDRPWFVDAWGVHGTGRLERRLAVVAADQDLDFVSWLETSLVGGDAVGRPGARRVHPSETCE